MRVGALELPFDPQSSELATATAWMLERVVSGELSEADVSDPTRWHLRRSASEQVARFVTFRRPLSAILDYEEARPDLARVRVVDDRGRYMVVRVWQHLDHPGVPTSYNQVLHPPDLVVREATSADAAALRELERRVPVQHQGATIAYDRPDPLRQDRLMGTVDHIVAERDGELVGSHSDVPHVTTVGGEPVAVMYRHHTRVLPEHQGGGVFPAMNGAISERHIRSGGPTLRERAWVAVANEKMNALALRSQSFLQWSTTTTRVSIPCSAAASDGNTVQWRNAEPGDADRIVALLDATHADRELYAGGRAIVDRLGAAPPDRAFGDLRCSERAVIGVWDDGWSATITQRDAVEHRRLATLAEWGAEAGAEEELVALVRDACHDLAVRGVTHLLVFTDRRTPAYVALAQLASDHTEYAAMLAMPEPPGTDDRGLYVDPIYF